MWDSGAVRYDGSGEVGGKRPAPLVGLTEGLELILKGPRKSAKRRRLLAEEIPFWMDCGYTGCGDEGASGILGWIRFVRVIGAGMIDWMRGRRGLRAKMVGWVLLPTAAILTAVGIVAFRASQRVTEDLVLDRNRDRTVLLANQLSAELEAYVRPLAFLASSATEESLYELQVALDREWPGGDLSAFDAGVLILDDEGSVAAAVPNSAHLYGESFPNLIAQDSATVDEDLELTDILFDEVAGMDVIALPHPLLGAAGGEAGTAVGLFHAERRATRTSVFYQRIWDLYIGRQETAFVVDGKGRVIFHPDTFLIGEDLLQLEAVARVLQRATGAKRTEDIEARDVVAGYAPIPRTSWGLVTEERWSEVTEAVRPFNRFMVALLALGVVVPVTVVALGVRRITRPVAEITRAAEEIAAGDFTQTIDVHTGDELETLARQFNVMAAELRASYANLEARVADRTRELSALNALAAVVSRSLELDAVMDAALNKTLEAMSMEAGAAFRLTDTGSLSLMAARGLSDLFVDQVREMDLQQSLAAQAVGESAPVLRQVDDYPDGALKDGLRQQEFRSIVSVPLVARDSTLGVLNLATRDQRGISAEERTLLASVGRQAGMAVENARLYEEAEAAAAAAERNRLARELHDAVSQTLFSASMIADVLPRLWEKHPEEAERRLGDLRRLTRGATAEMRTLLWELRPAALLEADLDELLGQLSKAVAGRAQLDVVVDVDPRLVVPVDVKVTLYRIAQEALNNVVRHASAEEVVLSVHGEGREIELSVRDDGRGFAREDIPPGHLGLSTMRERAESLGARFAVKSEPGKGTAITVFWRDKDDD